jgi:hypothetical protein
MTMRFEKSIALLFINFGEFVYMNVVAKIGN